LSRDEILSRWGKAPWPIFFSVALTGPGVLQTFRKLLLDVYIRLDQRHKLSERHGMTADSFVTAIMGDVEFKETQL
jgi:hypothetical protein